MLQWLARRLLDLAATTTVRQTKPYRQIRLRNRCVLLCFLSDLLILVIFIDLASLRGNGDRFRNRTKISRTKYLNGISNFRDGLFLGTRTDFWGEERSNTNKSWIYRRDENQPNLPQFVSFSLTQSMQIMVKHGYGCRERYCNWRVPWSQNAKRGILWLSRFNLMI